MASVKFFCWDIPVVGEGPTIEIGGEPFKFWKLDCGEAGHVTFRTKVQPDGTYSVQERLDNYLWKGDTNGGQGTTVFSLRKIVPDDSEGVRMWMQSHQWLPEVRNG